jgi:hypothetical protein
MACQALAAEIDQELVDLRGVGKDRRCSRIALDHQLGPGRERDAQQPGGVLHHLVQRQPAPLRCLRTRKRENPLNDLGGAPAGLVICSMLSRAGCSGPTSMRASSTLARMARRALLNSCAMPVASVPIACIFCACRSCSSRTRRLLVRLPALEELSDLAPITAIACSS